jgi:hypothetical protein
MKLQVNKKVNASWPTLDKRRLRPDLWAVVGHKSGSLTPSLISRWISQLS